MAEKKISWITETKAQITILDGVAQGDYQIDIEDYRYTPIGGLITIGEITLNGKKTQIKVRVEDIPQYQERYNHTSKALRELRQNIVAQINGKLDDQRYAREKWFESECKTTNLPQYGGTEALNAKLAEFDTNHLEIIAQIEAEKKAEVERHLWD